MSLTNCGDSNGDGTGISILQDFSNNLNYSFTATNNDPTETIRIRLALQDEDGRTLDVDTRGTNSEPFLGFVELTLQPGETSTLSGTLAGGGQAIFANAGECMNRGAIPSTGGDCIARDVDVTSISNVFLTVINNATTPDFQPLILENIEISIQSLLIGNSCDVVEDPTFITGTGNNDNTVSLEIYPNPVEATLNLSSETEKVSIFNAQGREVFSGTNVLKIDVSSLESGIYILRTDSASKTFIIE